MHSDYINQGLSIVGAACILLAYVGHQLKWLDPEGAFYNIINLVGAAVLGWVALFPFKIGFVILEFTWVLVSVYALVKSKRRRSTSA
jgi:hypothetical protein